MIMSNRTSQKTHSVVAPHVGTGRVRRKQRRGHEALLMAGCGGIARRPRLCGSAYLHLTLAYKADALNQSVADALREREFLQLRIAQAHSLAHVEQVATGKLGMVRPEATQYVVLDETARIASSEPATPAPEKPRGFIAIAVDWVAQHWPRLETAEAGGERR